jgi:hypothetical protein
MGWAALALWALPLSAAAQQGAPTKPATGAADDFWYPDVTRTVGPDGVELKVTGPAPPRLPVLQEGYYVVHVTIEPLARLRRNKRMDELPPELDSLLRGDPATIAGGGKDVAIEQGRWTVTETVPRGAPSGYRLVFDMTPQMQRGNAGNALARARFASIHREAVVLAFHPGVDTKDFIAQDVERLSRAVEGFLKPLAAAQIKAEHAVGEDKTTRFSPEQVPEEGVERERTLPRITPRMRRELKDNMQKTVASLESAIIGSPLSVTMVKLKQAADQDTVAWQDNERNDIAHSYLVRAVFARSVQGAEDCRKIIGAELFLYQRSILAELRDLTWRAYRRAQTDPTAWNAWKRKGVVAFYLEAMRAAHQKMLAVEDPVYRASYLLLTGAEPPKPGDPPQDPAAKPADPPKGLPYSKVEAFFAACDAKLAGGAGAADPDALFRDLATLLPQPPDELLATPK